MTRLQARPGLVQPYIHVREEVVLMSTLQTHRLLMAVRVPKRWSSSMLAVMIRY